MINPAKLLFYLYTLLNKQKPCCFSERLQQGFLLYINVSDALNALNKSKHMKYYNQCKHRTDHCQRQLIIHR